jgi:rSAM/selenodomain-associated transferase 2
MKPKSISIIIPTLNEEFFLQKTLTRLKKADVEIIVSDGGSRDRTVFIAEKAGAKVISSLPGRARQLNSGVDGASGSILLFLHADTILPEKFEAIIEKALEPPDVAAGAFRLHIDASKPIFRFIEVGANLRSILLQMPYGDQGLFMKKKILKIAGGYPDQPIMEDFCLIRSLKKHGRICIVSAHAKTSARRWLKQGIIKTTFKNQCIIAGFLLGVTPRRLARFYRIREKL